MEDLPAEVRVVVGERPKGSVKLFCGQIGREMDAAGYRPLSLCISFCV